MEKILLILDAGSLFLSAKAQTARVQVIHNSADAAAAVEDVFLTKPLG
jgi:hypothetical protein